MGLFKWPFGRKDGGPQFLDRLPELLGYQRESRAGVVVTVQSALDVTTVLACCRVIAEGVAQVPFKLYRSTADGREVAADHPLHDLLYRQPNSWQTSFEFRETLLFHLVLCGNAFVFVNRVGSDRRIAELILIEPGRVSVTRNRDYSLSYRVTAEGGAQEVFGQDAIWHLRGPSWNSWMGLDATRLARNAIGLAVAIEDQQAEFQKNGARTSGMIGVDDKLSPERFKLLEAFLDQYAAGGVKAGRPMIVDQGGKYIPFSMSAVDQQMLETRKHQVEEMCRAFRVMPIMIGQSDKAATYASAEQMFLAHVVHTLSPWYQRIEQSADVSLLSPAERAGGFYTKFLPNALMRGAAKDRGEFYAKALGSGGSAGWMTQNEIRELEELNRHPDGDELPKPAASAPSPEPKPNEDP